MLPPNNVTRNIAAVVCPNGLGHLKRTIGVLWEWNDRHPADTIHLFAEQWQIERLSDWPKMELLNKPKVHFYPGLLEPGLRLANEEAYTDGRLINWVDRLDDHPALQEADLVLSDNLSGVLKIRPDTILMGSFLWSDIFEADAEKSEALRKFVSEERQILDKYQPPMICVKDIRMPGLVKRTKAVEVPWFAQSTPIKRDGSQFLNRIALLGGATTIMDEAISLLGKKMTALPGWELFLPPHLLKSTDINAKAFGFELSDFANVDLVICRPGIGTITDCISTQTPMITFSENNNLEMDHNSEVLEQMGIAQIVRNENELLPTLLELSQNQNYANMVAQFSQLETTGIQKSLDWLEDHLTRMKS